MAGVPELETAKPKPNTKAVAQQQTIAVPPNANFTATLDTFANKLRKAPEGERNSTLNTLKYTLAGAFPDKLETIDEVLKAVALEIGLSKAEIDATLASANKGTERPITLKSNGGNRSKSNIMREALDNYFDGKLQWDEMKNKLRFRGECLSLEQLHDTAERELDLDLPFDNFKRIASTTAQRYPYHAARAYLQSLTVAADPTPILSALYQAMGVYSPLHRLYIRKWLISAVARALEPGQKADVALVLQGEQGKGKTTFFSSLFGEFFQTLGEHKSDVDQLLAMARSWCIEYGEIENAFSRKAVAAIKSFMSTESDTFRRPYASEPDEYPRHFVICGTTNQGEFLSDSTGNRRFWVVPATEDIDTEAITQMRDDVWAAVLALFLNKEQWWLTKTETALAALDTAQYEHVSPWEETIAAYLTHHTPCTLKDIMENALGFDLSRCNDKKAHAEITAILRKLGCTKKECRHKGVKGYYWALPSLADVKANDVRVTKENIPAVEYY
ncbi:MAG: virulence-associated E family protein [Nostoc sp.]|uniref:virulence-associated E family protein n=1 Tax=Nostoc sp. TaxID=1180 RepID=UPI002FFB4B27